MKSMKMSEGGRVVVPAEIRKALKVRDGDTVYWELVDGEARLSTKLSRLRRSQALATQFAGPRSVVDELFEQRRRESEAD